IAALLNQQVTIFGDGKQVRDMLYVDDLVAGYDAFIKSDLKHTVVNIGGGPENTLSLLEFLDFLQKEKQVKMKVAFSQWRPSDQKVYISDITKIKDTLGWGPKIGVEEGVRKLIKWAEQNQSLF
ncbi:MAG: GDP-mannose 4,6-dehydratase, partial [Candidatus Omnitrophica bacterium]|nr:GDP-mannose 4,6-dehydratase [Candidatus Omnitrophota bacterium]